MAHRRGSHSERGLPHPPIARIKDEAPGSWGRLGVVMTDDTSLRPILYVTAAIAILSAMDAGIKALGGAMPVPQIVLFRLVLGAAVALPILFLTVRPILVTRKSLKANGLRAVIMYITGLLFFFALTRLPLAEAITFVFTAPFFMAIAARVMLGEPIAQRSMIAILLGFVGMLVVVSGEIGSGWDRLDPLGVAAALSAAVFYALAIVLLRKHSADDPVPVLVTFQTCIGVIVALPLGLAAWEPVDVELWPLLVAIGIGGTIGHLLLASGFKLAPAARLAPIEYTGFLWAALLGYFFFDEIPAMQTYAGAAIIVVAALIVARQGAGKKVPVVPATRRTPVIAAEGQMADEPADESSRVLPSEQADGFNAEPGKS